MNDKGMMTIEACVIIPLSIFLSITILWIGIMVYNRTAIDYAVSGGLIYGGQIADKDNETVCREVRLKTAELLKDRLVLVGEPQITVSVEFGNIESRLEASMDSPPVPAMGELFKAKTWDLGVTKKVRRERRSQVIRLIHRLDMAAKEAGKEISGEVSEEEGIQSE
ncbi:MAG: hypothetical protein K6C99_08205 [Lachnospiraceae bacterium]|nr:hypothetical protein [Lachnospiraceae bacterium]